MAVAGFESSIFFLSNKSHSPAINFSKRAIGSTFQFPVNVKESHWKHAIDTKKRQVRRSLKH